MKRIDYSPTSKKIFSEMNCLLYTSDICKYTGMWQKQKYYDEITSYGTTAYFEIGFTGDIIMLDADLRGDVKFLLDQKEVFPSYENLFVIRTEPSSHTLCIRIYNDSHITIRKMYINGQYFKVPDKRYVQLIGDSITHCQPGFGLRLAEMAGFDHSIVAQGGMSLCDGFGWYKMPEWMKKRLGMESRYFQLECLDDGESITPYKFEYCREPDDIIIFIGTNDYLSTDEDRENKNDIKFTKAYINFIKRIREKFANSKIYLMKRVSGTNFCNECIQNVYNECSKDDKNILLLDSDKWGIDMSEDNVHPSKDGYIQIAQKLKAIMR